MDLRELIKEVNYQEEYSYDIRMIMFNNYSIPTSQKFFNPIFELAKFILGERSKFKRTFEKSWDNEEDNKYQFQRGFFNSYSHGGAILSSFNKSLEEGLILKDKEQSKTLNTDLVSYNERIIILKNLNNDNGRYERFLNE